MKKNFDAFGCDSSGSDLKHILILEKTFLTTEIKIDHFETGSNVFKPEVLYKLLILGRFEGTLT